MLPEWIQSLGKWRLLIIVEILSSGLSVAISAIAMKYLLGGVAPIGIWLGAVVPLLLSTPSNYFLIQLLFKLDKTQQDLHYLAITDELTNAYNRRYLRYEIDKEIKRCQRYGNTFSLIMLDCDDFKSINDEYGHPVGDQFLVNLTRECKKRIRKTDTFSRIGGDEFVLLLPNTHEEKALILAKELQEILVRVHSESETYDEIISTSFGVTSWHPEITSVEILLTNLDKALYQAKHLGKNCVAIFSKNSSSNDEEAPAVPHYITPPTEPTDCQKYIGHSAV